MTTLQNPQSYSPVIYRCNDRKYLEVYLDNTLGAQNINSLISRFFFIYSLKRFIVLYHLCCWGVCCAASSSQLNRKR